VVDHIFFNDQTAEGVVEARKQAVLAADGYESILGIRPRIVVWTKRRWPDLLSQFKACGEVNDFRAEDENDDDDDMVGEEI
jgi:hypothetical protein